MIYDARTNPRGYKLSIQQWPRDTRIMAIARMQGYRIPAATFTAPEATPARALLNHGVWRAWCPDCPFAAEDVWRGHNVFWCMRCGNLKAGRAWRPLIWPDNLEEIEAILADYPAPAQNWEPWGVPIDIKTEADAWVEHAAVMVDPEHGLSDNEAGGEDDPETYTTPVLAVTNAVIASSDANVDKGDIRYFRQFLSADPSGSGYWLQSSSANAAAWVARATALAAAVAELSSLSIPCNASVTGTLTASGNVSSSGGGGVFPGGVSCASGGGTFAGAVSGTQLQSSIATGTAPLTVASTTKVTNLNADLLDGVDGSGYQTALGYTPARSASGSYSGNNGASRQITTGFACKFVIIIAHGVSGSASIQWTLVSSTAANNGDLADTAISDAQFGATSDARLHASDGFIVDPNDSSNTSGNTYYYAAFG